MGGSPYVIEYHRAFSLPSPPDHVWSVLQRLDCFERWFGWLRELRVDGPGLEAGTVLHAVVAPPLPFRLRVRVSLLDCVPPRRIDATLHGDLEGHARLDLDADHGSTSATVSSSIEVRQRGARFAARRAPGFLRWAHDRVVEATVSSFRRRLVDEPD